MSNRILLIRTGGTIDSVPYDDPKHPPSFVSTLREKTSLIMNTIRTLPNYEDIDEFTWGIRESSYVKDSKLYTIQDIYELAQIIYNDDHRHFVITHGTDFIVKNAIALKEGLQSRNKVVVFTGAMVPLSMHQKCGSDGVELIRFVCTNIKRQDHGIYIVGYNAGNKYPDFFDPHTVEKDFNVSYEHLKFCLHSR